jgi:iron complex transport system permease protein
MKPCCRPWLLFFLLLLLALAGFVLALGSGSQGLGLAALFDDSHPQRATLAWSLVQELRLPRALCAFAVGGLLALAGVLMQVLLRNPLGDPYILGVSGGAAFAVLLSMLLGLPVAWLTGSAFGGALCSMLTVFLLARGEGARSDTRLLLTGVVMAAGWSALVSLVLALSPAQRLPGMLFWLMGDLSDADTPLAPLLLLGLGTLAALGLARPLDLLQQGESQAAALGVSTGALRSGIFLLGSLLTAAAVTVAGSIGFVGLVVPHMFRFLGGAGHRLLVPGSVLLGGTLLLLADTLARTLTAPQQLPVGVITALLGVPLFLYLLNRNTRLS